MLLGLDADEDAVCRSRFRQLQFFPPAQSELQRTANDDDRHPEDVEDTATLDAVRVDGGCEGDEKGEGVGRGREELTLGAGEGAELADDGRGEERKSVERLGNADVCEGESS